METGSGSAINELSRSKRRYQHQDQLLLGFYHMPESTAKEVAAEYFDWKYESYADAPKRAADLSSQRIGYLELVGNRDCRRSGKSAHVYRITDRGIEHLRKVGLLSARAGSVPVVERVESVPVKAAPRFADLRKALV